MTLDTSAGRLSPTRLEIPIQKPIFMTFANNGILYTIEKLDQDHAAITSFKEEGGHFTRLSSVSAPGTTTAYLAIDEERQLLFSANYHMSTVTTYQLDGQGGMQKADQVLKVGATGPRPQQELPHVHFANLTQDRRLVICDLGMDQVNIYNLTDQGQLKLVTTHQDLPGFGDRHLTFGRDGRFMYLVGELSSKLEVLAYDQENGELSSIQTVSTIPAD
ncbi:6-phosphogluconolactonase [Limosilactobacillus fermentum]